MAEIIHDISTMQRTAEQLRREGTVVGVVPTMGALHQGHLSLIRLARQRAGKVITTVFVNPTQFGPQEDFSRYPRDLARDVALAGEAGTDYVFAPATEAMYPSGSVTSVQVDQLTTVLEGRSRPTHFRGVTTVVAKLFHITKPHIAVFGQKDAQQVAVIRRMVHDLNFDVEIVVAPIVREADGLAMSSRNVYLTAQQRSEAPVLFRALGKAEERIRRGERNCDAVRSVIEEEIRAGSSAVIDYVSIADAASLQEQSVCRPGSMLLISLAARFGSTRLIDNITLTPEETHG